MLAAAIAAPKISFETFAMIFFSASGLCYRRAGDWITLPQIPSAFLNTMQGCHLQRLKHETNHHRSSRLHRNVSLCWRMVCLLRFRWPWRLQEMRLHITRTMRLGCAWRWRQLRT